MLYPNSDIAPSLTVGFRFPNPIRATIDARSWVNPVRGECFPINNINTYFICNLTVLPILTQHPQNPIISTSSPSSSSYMLTKSCSSFSSKMYYYFLARINNTCNTSDDFLTYFLVLFLKNIPNYLINLH